MRKILAIFIIYSQSLLVGAQISMPLDTLYHQFEKVKAINDKDNGRLWGKSLYGPILVIDKISRRIVANQPDLEGQLQQQGKVYVGYYPQNSIIVCTATTFAGKSWALISYPFDAKDTLELYRNYIHESYHRIQGELGINCLGYDNSQMDKMDARIYLNLEWEALLKAVDTTGTGRNRAIKDALLFRQYRRHLFPGSDSMENRFELHEGLAEYTAFKLCCNSETELKEQIIQRKSKYLNKDGSCIRTFGYFSGLLYGYLLDETRTLWQKKLQCGDDLGLLLQKLSNIDISKDTVHWFNQSKARYPFEEIYNQELEVYNKKEKIGSDYKIKFTENPVLIMDLVKPTYGIYRSPCPLDTFGTVYPIIDISDKWGFLKVTDKGCLIASKKAIIAADKINIKEQTITGDGWFLELNTNWTIVKQNDNYLIKEKMRAR